MRKLLIALLAIVLIVPLVGCGGDKDKGINKDKDKPRAADK